MFGLAIQTPEPITFITGLTFDGKGSYILKVVMTKGEARALTCGGSGPKSVQALAEGTAFLCVDSPCGKRWTVQVNPQTRAVRVTPQGEGRGDTITLPESTLAAMIDQVTNAAEARLAYSVIADQLEQKPEVAAKPGILRQVASIPDDNVVMTLWLKHGPMFRRG